MVAGLATLAAFDDEDIVARAQRTGLALSDGLKSMADRYELISDVRGLGLMIGIEFGEPESRSASLRFRAVERLRHGMFSQLVVVPLFHRHRILTQVAADNVNIVKLLPPLITGPEEVDYFLEAFEDVMADAHRGSGLTYEFGKTMARGALGRKAARTVQRPVSPAAADAPVGQAAPHRVQRDPGVAAEAGYAPAARRLEAGDRVVVTGASGFIGSAVMRSLTERGAHVVAVVEPGADLRNVRTWTSSGRC